MGLGVLCSCLGGRWKRAFWRLQLICIYMYVFLLVKICKVKEMSEKYIIVQSRQSINLGTKSH